MNLKAMGGALFALVASTQGATAQALVEEYVVNAQYRDGAIHKAFRDLGRGKASYEATGPARFRVKMKGNVQHPDGTLEYSFNLSQTFQLSGNDVKLVATEKEEMNEHSKPHESWITELVPFAYLARRLPVPDLSAGGDTARTLRYRGHSFVLRYGKTEKQVEVTLEKDNDTVGKFFLGGGGKGFQPLDKFRMAFPKAKIMITFSVSSKSGSLK